MYLYYVSRQKGRFGWVQLNCIKAKKRGYFITRCHHRRNPGKTDGRKICAYLFSVHKCLLNILVMISLSHFMHFCDVFAECKVSETNKTCMDIGTLRHAVVPKEHAEEVKAVRE